MTVATEFFDWSHSGVNWNVWPYESCSPNLMVVMGEVRRAFGGLYLGCEGDRDVVGGDAPSVHSWGRAYDWRWRDPGPGRLILNSRIIPWLINYSRELHVQAVHDYDWSRIWRPPAWRGGGDGWLGQPHEGQMRPGNYWIHVETNQSGDMDATPLGARGVPLLDGSVGPDPPQPPKVQTVKITVNMEVLKVGRQSQDARRCQSLINARARQQVVAEDGDYGDQTAAAVRWIQSQENLKIDGECGPATWSVLLEGR